jgi:hypothetical protein
MWFFGHFGIFHVFCLFVNSATLLFGEKLLVRMLQVVWMLLQVVQVVQIVQQ